ncbi:hypothetical protein J437_LFUL010476 [Ladona fulva]|uniref:Retroviral polymerase SH3-like domain-containing protein n=1 Tax=Ladona fulva TaxID=123851 RepID=A0A8K0KJS1_LADFU|nr:hypothetical protein J437_LFUL010476 [Ladona fulva]
MGTRRTKRGTKEYQIYTYVLEKSSGREKLEPQSKEGTLVGYSGQSKGYHIWIPEDKKVVVARDLHFIKDPTGSKAEREIEIPVSSSKEETEEDRVSIRCGNKVPETRAEPSGVENRADGWAWKTLV